MYDQALQIYGNLLHPEHSHYIRCKNYRKATLSKKELLPLENLAKNAADQGDYDQALEKWDQAVRKSEHLFGPDD